LKALKRVNLHKWSVAPGHQLQ